jgi:hypothetical protein
MLFLAKKINQKFNLINNVLFQLNVNARNRAWSIMELA